MKNGYKVGRAISDNHIKSVKKLIKDKVYVVESNGKPEGWIFDYYINNSIIKITSIRKYRHANERYRDDLKYAYEIDVIVDMTNTYHNADRYSARRMGSMVRGPLLRRVDDELKYFGIDAWRDATISKINFQKGSLI